jgi:hypothetical protein
MPTPQTRSDSRVRTLLLAALLFETVLLGVHRIWFHWVDRQRRNTILARTAEAVAAIEMHDCVYPFVSFFAEGTQQDCRMEQKRPNSM